MIVAARQLDRAGETMGEFGIVADENERARSSLHLAEQETNETITVVCVKCGGWLVGDNDLGSSDECSSHRHPLLLPNAELRYRLTMKISRQVQRPQYHSGGGCQRPTADTVAAVDGSTGSALGERARQNDIFKNREIRQQVKLLEHDPQMIGPKLITPAGGERAEIRPKQFDPSRVGHVDTSQKVQQGGLAATAGPSDKQVLTGVDPQPLDSDGVR